MYRSHGSGSCCKASTAQITGGWPRTGINSMVRVPSAATSRNSLDHARFVPPAAAATSRPGDGVLALDPHVEDALTGRHGFRLREMQDHVVAGHDARRRKLHRELQRARSARTCTARASA